MAISKKFNHFWVIADLFRQIRGHSSRFVLFLELVSKDLNHLAAILHVYAGGFELNEVKKKLLLFFKKKMEILLHILSFLK